jgi:hypothetical protein
MWDVDLCQTEFFSAKTQYKRGLDVREAATNIWTSSTAHKQPPGYRKLDSLASVIALRRPGPHTKAIQLLFQGSILTLLVLAALAAALALMTSAFTTSGFFSLGTGLPN